MKLDEEGLFKPKAQTRKSHVNDQENTSGGLVSHVEKLGGGGDTLGNLGRGYAGKEGGAEEGTSIWRHSPPTSQGIILLLSSKSQHS